MQDRLEETGARLGHGKPARLQHMALEKKTGHGDGVGEVFATMGAFDGYALLVFKKVAGRWRQVHDQIGDLC